MKINYSLLKQIFLYLCFFLFQVISASVLTGSSNTIKISVIDSNSKLPLEKCIVFITDIEKNSMRMLLTDNDGSVTYPVRGERFIKIKAKRLGYETIENGPFKLSLYDTLKVKFMLTSVPVVLEDVIVVDTKSETLERNGFYKRKEIGIGHFMEKVDLEKRNLADVSGAIAHLPGVSVIDGKIRTRIHSGLNSSYMVLVYIDGIRVWVEGFANTTQSLNDYINPDDIEGIEFYSRLSEVPIEYRNYGSNAGVLLIWTK